MEESYLTVIGCNEVLLVEKRSKFLGYMKHVASRQDAENFLKKLKDEHKSASHHVPAYLLREFGVMFCSDDGEPHGTAGKPILEVLKKKQIFDVCVVVVRYFGGTLLGTGGLVFAYSEVCKRLVESATIAMCVRCSLFRLVFDYSNCDRIMRVLQIDGAKIVLKEFGEVVKLEVLVKNGLEEGVKESLTKVAGGNIVIEFVKETCERFEV